MTSRTEPPSIELQNFEVRPNLKGEPVVFIDGREAKNLLAYSVTHDAENAPILTLVVSCLKPAQTIQACGQVFPEYEAVDPRTGKTIKLIPCDLYEALKARGFIS